MKDFESYIYTKTKSSDMNYILGGHGMIGFYSLKKGHDNIKMTPISWSIEISLVVTTMYFDNSRLTKKLTCSKFKIIRVS